MLRGGRDLQHGTALRRRARRRRGHPPDRGPTAARVPGTSGPRYPGRGPGRCAVRLGGRTGPVRGTRRRRPGRRRARPSAPSGPVPGRRRRPRSPATTIRAVPARAALAQGAAVTGSASHPPRCIADRPRPAVTTGAGPDDPGRAGPGPPPSSAVGVDPPHDGPLSPPRRPGRAGPSIRNPEPLVTTIGIEVPDLLRAVGNGSPPLGPSTAGSPSSRPGRPAPRWATAPNAVPAGADDRRPRGDRRSGGATWWVSPRPRWAAPTGSASGWTSWPARSDGSRDS